MSPRKPSELLTTLSSSLPHETFLKVLKSSFYPALDALPAKSLADIVTVLEVAQKEYDELARRIQGVNYDEMEKDLNNDIKRLKKHVKRDWHDGWEVQGEMMGEIAGSIYGWLPTLWAVGVEHGVEPNLIHKSLKLCFITTGQVDDCGSRTEFSDLQGNVSFSIADRSNNVIYQRDCPNLYGAISWVWRELLLVTLSNDENLVKVFMDDIDRLGSLKDVENLLREDEESETKDGYSFCDEHWSAKMRETVPRLKQLFTARRIASFEKNPTFENYRSLVAVAPDLKPNLVDVARRHFFDETDKQPAWGHAVEIFKAAKSSKDLVRILEKIGDSIYITSGTKTAKRNIVSHLMGKSDEYRAKARIHLEDGLSNALQVMWDEIGEAFPGLEEAYEYLEEKLESKKITKKDKRTSSQYYDSKRNEILDRFIKIARSGGYGGDSSDVEDYRYDMRMNGIDEDDSDYGEMTEQIHPDIAGDIEAWLAIVNKWPNAAEAEEIRNKFRAKRTNSDLFFTVDGVAEELASRCDFEWNHSSRRVHIAEGIRAAYAAFGPNQGT